MKFLDCKNEKKNLSDIKYFLRSKGVFVSTTDDFSDSPSFDSKTGVWVIFDNQFQDACKLLRNKKHKTSDPFSIDEMKEFEKNSKELFFKSSQSLFENLFAIILGVVFFSFILFIIISAIVNR